MSANILTKTGELRTIDFIFGAIYLAVLLVIGVPYLRYYLG